MKKYKVLKHYQQLIKGKIVQLDENDFFTFYYIKKNIIEQLVSKRKANRLIKKVETK